ncbi:uncharacterized protein EHS24_003760 [Apiotrichum porosum]|uniref:Major facilitator superfamily (MFS) profile domain-containing protein n=1 Tax=Apiotrichum porosum TaxID=105984 RepID=A0A427XDY4_9TREE|nr:uncharacterized protein EHS24_003760 [Apiotrichum porosum]RSH77130.1 hypothetical protein EHS24_003760 [Apiotrichum porosum]
MMNGSHDVEKPVDKVLSKEVDSTLAHATVSMEAARPPPSVAEDDMDPSLPPPVPLRPITTTHSTRSQRAAAHTIDNFEMAPENPRNWSKQKKWRLTLVIAITAFVTTSASSMVVPGIDDAMKEYGESNHKVGVLISTTFVLGMGAGPFLFAPISELYGRQVAYHTSQACYVPLSIGAALAPNMATLLVLRFLCGICGSVGTTLGIATVADVFSPAERGLPVSTYTLGPMLSPVIATMVGYWVLYGGWRWLLWTPVILAAFNWFLLLIATEETYAPIIIKRLQYEVTHPQEEPPGWRDKLSPRRLIHNLAWMSAMVSRDQARQTFGRAFSRPPRLLFTNPVCALFALYYGYLYACIYIFLVTIPLLYTHQTQYPNLFSYEWPQYTAGLAYVGLGIGYLIASVTGSTQQDKIYRRLSARNKDNGQPEYRLLLTQVGVIILPIGCFVFGWTAHFQAHWIAPQVGECLVAWGLMVAFNSLQTFLIDAFYPYSAAATAAAIGLRSAMACVLPVFTPEMFGRLGWGWGGTVLAFVALSALPAPLIVGLCQFANVLISQMFKYGRRLRERFQFEG